MQYRLTAGRVLSKGEWVALGSVLTLDDDEAARYRLGGCTLEPVTDPPPAGPAGAEAIEAEPAPRRRGRKPRAPRQPAED